MTAILEVEEVAKHFGALKAVDGVSFAVDAGEIFGIAGPNGSGKSTLFNILTGIPYAPLRGRVRFKGQAVERMPAHLIARLGLARTFQRDAVFPSLSARESARLAAIHGHGKVPEPARVEALLTACGLPPERFDLPSGALSVFEKKKLTIATALASAPTMLLLDEPASGLTRPEVTELAALIRSLPGQGVTVLVIEHVLSLLFEVCARLMVLNQGRVLATGAPDDVMRDERVIEAYLGRRGSRLHAAAHA